MTDPFSGIRHISLDVWSTLIEPNSNFKNARTDLFRHFFSLKIDADEASAALSNTAALVNQLNAVSGKCMDRSETILLALQRVGFEAVNTSEDQLSAFFIRMDELFEMHPPFLASPELPSLMQKMNSRYSFSILSNTLYIEGKSLSRFFEQQKMSDLFRFQIYSDEVNMSKPSRSVFNLLIAQAGEFAGASSENIIHIGDNIINDISGATQSGLQSLLIDQNNTLAHYFRR